MRVTVNDLDLLNQAAINLLLGFGLALINVLVRYFVPRVPYVMSVLRWRRAGRPFTRVLIITYTIAFVLQLITSPIFRSLVHSVSLEAAWSFYQAFWNIVGILVMDVIMRLWTMTRAGVAAGQRQMKQVQEHVAEVTSSTPFSIDDAVGNARRQEQAAMQAAERAERQERLQDRLGKY